MTTATRRYPLHRREQSARSASGHRGTRRIAECAIVPKPDPVLGERACCFVVLEPGQSALRLEELCVWLGEHGIAKNQWPEHLEILSGMPTTPTRKVMKGELMWRARELE